LVYFGNNNRGRHYFHFLLLSYVSLNNVFRGNTLLSLEQIRFYAGLNSKDGFKSYHVIDEEALTGNFIKN
jgi:hypothetical protein